MVVLHPLDLERWELELERNPRLTYLLQTPIQPLDTIPRGSIYHAEVRTM